MAHHPALCRARPLDRLDQPGGGRDCCQLPTTPATCRRRVPRAHRGWPLARATRLTGAACSQLAAGGIVGQPGALRRHLLPRSCSHRRETLGGNFRPPPESKYARTNRLLGASASCQHEAASSCLWHRVDTQAHWCQRRLAGHGVPPAMACDRQPIPDATASLPEIASSRPHIGHPVVSCRRAHRPATATCLGSASQREHAATTPSLPVP